MSFEDTFKDLLARYIRKYRREDIAEVLSYTQAERAGGYCDSCYYEEIVVEVSYRSTDGKIYNLDIHENMSELIDTLSRFDRENE